ncbi:23S rRNA (pseudouridine(1915)-N(3))-methyltransferase RlmH [Aquibium oceanicum]|uniref:Ribosomal RNA large subunit methyltransferase H n=1 Tax=Aquibium oceanicum TaxID=1670800 RepID=A0A1L3SLF0_9HYPH|nr:23S rRNA (pseudouridine(1915)-N(3))-methyltransferase RlmH [Aquibium oceanicum]APH70191.1 23S rRNA (pseudouridine(1915)-N(3))-methyltransferase RlmH [Aquibium oceanicum]
MKIAVHAVGRMKAGPERELADRYLDRFAKAGPPVGLEWAGLTEIAESRAQGAAERKRDEAQRLDTASAAGTALVILDERGKNLSSEALASWIGERRDQGQRDMLFAIGGPDGHAEDAVRKAALVLSFGSLTWPHQLARVMLAEQLYRVVMILSGHPYHRA